MTLGLKKHYSHANLFFSTLARSRLDLHNLRRIACDTPLMLLFSLLNVLCLSLSSSMTCCIYESGALIVLMFLFGVGSVLHSWALSCVSEWHIIVFYGNKN